MPRSSGPLVLIGLDSVSLPLVRYCLSRGASLPAIESIFRDGAASEAVPELPAYTPTNWATIATGARVGSTGAADWVTNVDGLPGLSTFDSRAISAETIFETCARHGLRTLAIGYPGSSPRRGDGMVVAPLPNGLVSLALAPGIELLANRPPRPGARVIETKQARLPGATGSRAVEADISVLASDLHAGRGTSAAAARAGVKADGARVKIDALHEGPATEVVVRLVLRISVEAAGPRAKITTDSEASVALPTTGWSDWLNLYVGLDGRGQVPASVRFKLRWLSADGTSFSIIRSEIYPTIGFTEPPELADILLHDVGPYLENPSTVALGHLEEDAALDAILPTLADDLDVAFEEAQYQVDWIIRSAAVLKSHRGWDVLYLHWHFPDTIIHRLLAAVDRLSPGFRPDLESAAEGAIGRCMEIADSLVGGLRSLVGPEGHTFVVSDHGNVPDRWWANVPVRLVQMGLAVLDSNGNLDEELSPVIQSSPLQLRINRAAIDSADPASYASLQEAAIDALLDWRDPKGKRVVALALKKDDAQLLGMWGSAIDDVVYCLNDDFSWPDAPPETLVDVPDLYEAPLFPNGAHHGPKLPTARGSVSSNLALLLMAGPGIRRGFDWDGRAAGWPRLVDVVPTICFLLGIAPPAQTQGAVLSAFLEPTE